MIEFENKEYEVEVISIDKMIDYVVDNCSYISKCEVYPLDRRVRRFKDKKLFEFYNEPKRALIYLSNV